jgi:hypothetical protein
MKNVALAGAMLLAASQSSLVQSGPGGRWRADGLPWTMEFEVVGNRLTGTVDQDGDGVDPAAIFEGDFKGSTLRFKADSGGSDRTITFTGVLSGDEIVFTRTVQVREGRPIGGRGMFGSLGPARFTVRRVSQTAETTRAAPSGPSITIRPAAALGQGDGSAGVPQFERALLLEDEADESANISFGDLNADGHLDVVLAKGRHSPRVDRVFLNDGRGGFPSPHNLGEASDRSYSASLADMDGDGDLDVVMSNDRPDPKLVYLNDGKGKFGPGSTYGQPEWPTRNASVAELNGDRLPDIVVANRFGSGGGSNYVCINRGGGRFDRDCVAFAPYSATTITPADFNNDGFIDLAVPHRDGGQSHVYLNDGKAGFSARIPFGGPNASIRMVAAADLNGDRLVDLVSIDEGHRATFLYFNLGNGAFTAGSRLGDSTDVPYALGVGDLSGDGRTDIVVGHVEARPIAYVNDGSGRSFTARQFGDHQGTAYGFAFGDLDRDGVTDIGVARSGAPNVVYFGGPTSPRMPAARP